MAYATNVKLLYAGLQSVTRSVILFNVKFLLYKQEYLRYKRYSNKVLKIVSLLKNYFHHF